MPDVFERLREITLFSRLSLDNLRALARIVKRTRLARGATIVRQGDIGRTMFVVHSGMIVALALDERGQPTPPRFLHPGDHWGETSLLIGEPRDATMKVREDAELLYIQKSDFDRLLEERPRLWDQLVMRKDVRIKLQAPRFPWLGPDERVEWFSNKHWIFFVRRVITVLVLWAIAMLALSLLAEFLTWTQISLVALGALGLVSPWIIWSYIDWQDDFHVVTSRRVVHMEKVLFRLESRDEAPLDKVQNTSIQQDFLGNLLGYAHMRINTAGAISGRVDFFWVADPELVTRVIVEQIRRFSLRQRSREEGEIQKLLKEHLSPTPQELPNETSPGSAEADQPSPTSRRDPLSLLNRGKGCSRMVVDTGLFSFLMHPHFPRVGVITEGRSIIWRKHWIVLVRHIALPLVVFLVALGGTLFGLWMAVRGQASWAVVLAAFALTGLLFFWLTWCYEDWRNDLYVVTDRQILDIERTPLLARESSRQANLENIQDIRYEVPGFWYSMLKMGSVVIATAGEGQFTFDHVYNPSGVQQVIFERLEALRQQRLEAERKQRETELAQWFTIYHQNKHGEAPANKPPEFRPEADQ